MASRASNDPERRERNAPLVEWLAREEWNTLARAGPGSETVPTEAGALAAIPYPRAVTDGRDRESRAVGPVRSR